MKSWRGVYHSILLLFLGTAVAACGLFEGGGGNNANPEPPPNNVTAVFGGGQTPGSLSAKVLQGGPNPSPLSVALRNDGDCSLSYTVSTMTVDGKSWLSVSPTTGSLASLASTTLSVAIDVVTPALAPGTYTGTITIAGTCSATQEPAVGSPIVISVNLTVTPTSAIISADQSALAQDVVNLEESWQPTSRGLNVPSARDAQTAVWTGAKMIVWGGEGGGGYLNDGGVYNPATDTWSPISTTNAPTARAYHTAIWTGSKMIVWGGFNAAGYLNAAGIYDPADGLNGSWTAISMNGAPAGRYEHTAIWTGTRMIIWGGHNSTGSLNEGGVYNPATDTWSPISTANAPTAREYHTAVWTGSRMIVWGGFSAGYLNDGGIYNPATNAWSTLSTTNAPAGRYEHTAVWTGTKMIIWGGRFYTFLGEVILNDGGVYDPATDTWSPTSTTNAPTARYDHTAVWTGSKMIVWGGFGVGYFNDGGLYDPADGSNGSWAAISTTDAPGGRYLHSVVWTGSKMVIWGGWGGYGDSNTGGTYKPAAVWSATSTAGAPAARQYHTAIWTGAKVIVWGGAAAGVFNDGGLYNPATDIWSGASTTNAPSARAYHTAIWTGAKMIVWGGGW